jgi:hypothetical protein
LPDAQRRQELLLALAQRFDDTHRRLIGEIGEDLVLEAARAELQQVGHADLARSVRRVSLTSDQLGYDVTALASATQHGCSKSRPPQPPT